MFTNMGRPYIYHYMGNELLNGKLITSYMKKTGLNFYALASLIGVSHNTIRAMEKGYIPKEKKNEILAQLSSRMKCSVKDLIISVDA